MAPNRWPEQTKKGDLTHSRCWTTESQNLKHSWLLQAAIDSEEPATLQELTLDLDRLQETKRKLRQHEEADEENLRKDSTFSLDPIPDEQEASRSYPAPKATPYLLKEKVPANMEYMNYADPESFMEDFSDLVIAEGIPKSQWIRVCIGRINKGMRKWAEQLVTEYEARLQERWMWL